MLEVHPYYLSHYAIWPYLPERYLSIYIYSSISAEHCLPFFIFTVHRNVQLKAQLLHIYCCSLTGNALQFGIFSLCNVNFKTSFLSSSCCKSCHELIWAF